MLGHGLAQQHWVDPQKNWVGLWVNAFLLRVKNFGLGQVFFGSGQQILTHFAMSTYGHTRGCVQGPHLWLGHGSNTICNNPAPTPQILSTLEPIPITDLFFPSPPPPLHQSTQQWGKRPIHIKEKSLLIRKSPCTFLNDVRFHGLQDPLLGLYNLVGDFLICS